MRKLALIAAFLSTASVAHAHVVTVDGSEADWSARVPLSANQGIVARGTGGTGEYVFVDATGDHRTDSPSTTNQDITRLQITADATNLYFLVRAAAADLTQTPQIQISIDTDRVDGSGQDFLGGFNDTRVTSAAEWEFLVQTTFGDTLSTGAHVYDAAFVEVADVTGVYDAVSGAIEIAVPWSALGLSAPPTTAPLRFTASSYISTTSADEVAHLGDSTVSDAFDAIGDCGNPANTGHPNAFACDLSDADLDYSADVWFEADGDVYAPLLVSHFITDAATAPVASTEFVVLRNVTPSPIELAGFKVGDEEQPDGTGESMGTLPSVTLSAGDTFIVAQNGATYQTRFGELPDAEFAGATAAPDMGVFSVFINGSGSQSWALANGGDQILVLDPSNTVLDVASYGSGAGSTYPGIDANPAVPGDDQLLIRTPSTQDTDSNATDLVLDGVACLDAAACGAAACNSCNDNVCAAGPVGVACEDGDLCNGAETCNAAGSCVAGTPVTCADPGLCANAVCNPGTGSCEQVNEAPGTSCDDTDACNGIATCDGAGVCEAGTSVVCADPGECANAECNSTTGACDVIPEPLGTLCADGDLCDGTETCDGAGACAAGSPVTCTDPGACANSACNPGTGTCDVTPEAPGVSCTDGDACNGAELCDGVGVCSPGTPVVCSDPGACSNSTCNSTTGACDVSNEPAGTTCADSDLCDGAESCNGSGACVAGTPVTCTDPGACADAACNPTTGACDTTNEAAGVPCPDGSACNGAETCNGAGVCAAGTPVTCADPGVCTNAACIEPTGTCSTTNEPAGTACPDLDLCDGAETCDGGGSCVDGTPVTCTDPGACADSACNPASGSCDVTNLAAGTSCSDGSVCNGSELCNGIGACVSGAPLICIDGEDCTTDGCDPADGCEFTPIPAGESCSDGDVCDGAETCDAGGNCVAGTPLDCVDDGEECTVETCDATVGCLSTPDVGAECDDDGNACNGVSTCDPDGNCVAGPPVDCPPSVNPCAQNICNVATGACDVVPDAVGADCDDGDPCNGTDTCDGAGACVPGLPPIDGGVCDLDAGPSDAGPSDAGTSDGGASDGGSSDATTVDAAGQPDAYIPDGDDDGCGCRAGAPSRGGLHGGMIVLVTLGAALLIRRRRRP